MLTTLRRKQKGIMIVVAIVVIIAFAFLYSEYDFDQVTSLEAFSVDGRKYRVSEVQALNRSLSIAAGLAEREFINALQGFNNKDPNPADAVINLLVLRNESENLGVRPSEDEIAKYIKNHQAFQSLSGGGYDAALFEQFNERYLSPQGLGIRHLSNIVGDIISYQAIRDLVGANVHPSPTVIDEYFARDYTQVTASRVDIPRDALTGEVKVTEEEIKTYYEQNKATLLSDPKRRIEYVFFARPKDPVKPDPPKDPADAASSDAPAEDAAAAEAAEAERKAQLKAYGEQVAAFSREVLAEGANFADIAKTHEADLVSTPPFSYSEPPEELGDARQLLGAVFTRSLEVPISDPIDTPEGYYLFNLLEVKEPESLSLEDASGRIRELLTDRAVAAREKTAVSGIRTKLLDALKGGKSFEDAAQALGLEAKEIATFSRARPPYDQPDSSVLAAAATELEAGELSESLSGVGGAFLVYVKETKPLADETAISTREDIAANIRRIDQLLLFSTWFEKAKEAAGVRQATAPAPAAQG